MTKPVNRLDEFQTHSIHYVVLAARTTDDVRAFTQNSDTAQAQTLQAIDRCKRLGDAVALDSNSGDSVFLVMDTRRFSQFTIEQFAIDTRVAGFAVPGSNTPNAVGTEMTFNVLDSTGISFANFLQYLMDQKLKVSFDGMTLLVRILFIGHKADGTTKVVQSIGIPAIFNTIQVDLNEVKGIYTCKCFPLIGMSSNGGYNAKWTSIGSSTNYFTGVGANTLGAVIKSFEQRLNDESLSRYREYNGITQTAGEAQKTAARFGRPVQYMITIPSTWEPMPFSGPTQGAAVEINFAELIKKEEDKKRTAAEQQKTAQANASAPAKDSFVSVDPTLTITEVLDVIFSQTVGVRELANFPKNKPNPELIKFYKHLITVTSDDASFTVHIDVVEFSVPNVNSAAESSAKAIAEAEKELYTIVNEKGSAPKRVPKNFYEFDYIFSGTNIDVLSLDLKIENLNLLLMQGTKIGQGELWAANDDGQKQTDGTTAGANTTTVQGRGAKDPVLLRTLTPEERTNFSNLAGNLRSSTGSSPQEISQQYTKNLSDFYNSRSQAKMTIRGNPDFLDRVTLTAMPKHVSAVTITSTNTSSTNDDVKRKWREALEARVLQTTFGPSIVSSPFFIKVNVYGPNVDFITLDPMAGDQNFAKKLLTDNFYWCGVIRSKIEGAKFTQELDLQSYSVYGHSNLSAQGQTGSTTKVVK